MLDEGGWEGGGCISEAVWLWPASTEHTCFFTLVKEQFLLYIYGISALATRFSISYSTQQKGTK